MALLRLNGLCKEYRRGGAAFRAVDRASLTLEAGDFASVIGRSGSGKSTLLNMAAGLLRPTTGTVELEGTDLASMDDAALSQLRNERVGFIPQGASALPNLTVLENVMLPFCLWPREGDGEGTARLALEHCGADRLADAYPSELSGGELRRAMIARALVNRPALLIADEPTSGLDVESARGVMELFSKLNGEGLALLLASHDLEALRYGKRVFTMSEGRLIEGERLTKQAVS